MVKDTFPAVLLEKCYKYQSVSRLIGLMLDGISVKKIGNLESPAIAAPKKEPGAAEYRHKEHTITHYDPVNDRVFPLETVMLGRFNDDHNKEVNTPLIHTGASIDDYLHSMRLLAMTVRSDIFIRNSHYKPETDEGQKLIAHELTHVSQYQEKRITGNSTRDELEKEAEDAEYIPDDIFESDPVEIITFRDGTKCKMKKSEKKKFIHKMVDDLIEWINEQKIILPEEDYLKLLLTLDNYRKDYFIRSAKTSGDAFYNEIVEAFKSELNWQWG